MFKLKSFLVEFRKSFGAILKTRGASLQKPAEGLKTWSEPSNTKKPYDPNTDEEKTRLSLTAF